MVARAKKRTQVALAAGSPEQEAAEGREEEHGEDRRGGVRLRPAAAPGARDVPPPQVMMVLPSKVGAGSAWPLLEQRLVLHFAACRLSRERPGAASSGSSSSGVAGGSWGISCCVLETDCESDEHPSRVCSCAVG